MDKFLAFIFKALGNLGAGASNTACVMWVIDEPKAPKSIIEK